MPKIESLTKDQRDRFPEFVKRWTDIGLSTSPANRAEAERGVRLAYEKAGLKAPTRIVWCGSPLSQGLTRSIVLDIAAGKIKIPKTAGSGADPGDSVGDSVRDSVWDSVGDSVGDSVWASVRASVWDSVRDSVRASVGDSVGDSVRASVGDSVWASVRASVWASVRASVWASVRASVRASVGDSVWASVRDSVWASVGDSVWASVRDSVWASVGDSVWASGYGQHDSEWLGFYEYFAEVCQLDEATKKLEGLWLIAKNAGWFLPHRDTCWITERHNVLNRDANGRLHCENGPALTYPDGFAIWAWHGVRVAQAVIEQPVTVKQIDAEDNAEVRRIMMERYGEATYLVDSGAAEIHRDDFGILFRKNVPNDEPIVMVKVLNSTPEPDGSMTRDEALSLFPALTPICHDGLMIPLEQAPVSSRFKSYMIRVPPAMQRSRQAVAWTFGKQEEAYAPLMQS